MLQLEISTCEGCNEFEFSDTTKLYNVDTRPGGYGPENGVDDPSSFDSYSLEVRYPNTPISSPPDATFDLLTAVPPIDSSENYVWTITAADLGLTKFVSGVYTFTARGVIAGNTYLADVQCIFINDLQDEVDAMMIDYDPTCPCKTGCSSPADLFAEFLTVKCGGICDAVKAQSIITSLYQSVPSCC